VNVTNSSETEDELDQWRTKILNVFLVVAAVAAGVVTVGGILDATSRTGEWAIIILAGALTLVLAALAIFRGIPSRIRAWGVLLVTYIMSVTSLATYGLGSSGRLYLLALPIGALILIGVKAGILMSALSFLTIAAFALLAFQGVLPQWLLGERSSLLGADWLIEGIETLGLLAIVMALLILFYRFQERLIDQEHRERSELIDVQRLLEQEKATLEQRVEDRTAELAEATRFAEKARASA